MGSIVGNDSGSGLFWNELQPNFPVVVVVVVIGVCSAGKSRRGGGCEGKRLGDPPLPLPLFFFFWGFADRFDETATSEAAAEKSRLSVSADIFVPLASSSMMLSRVLKVLAAHVS